MAAIIAANNTTSGDGVAPGAHLVNVKVGAGDGTVDVSQVIAAIDWVVANRNINGNNIRVINLAYDTDAAAGSPARSALTRRRERMAPRHRRGRRRRQRRAQHPAVWATRR